MPPQTRSWVKCCPYNQSLVIPLLDRGASAVREGPTSCRQQACVRNSLSHVIKFGSEAVRGSLGGAVRRQHGLDCARNRQMSLVSSGLQNKLRIHVS